MGCDPTCWWYNEAAKAPIKKNFNIKEKDKYGRTLLSSIAFNRHGLVDTEPSYFDYLSQFQKLLDIGARLSSAQMTGHTLLTAAIKIPSFILVKAFPEQGDEPNERGDNGLKPLLGRWQPFNLGAKTTVFTYLAC